MSLTIQNLGTSVSLNTKVTEEIVSCTTLKKETIKTVVEYLFSFSDISITFKGNLKIKDFVKEVEKIERPLVYLWYFGYKKKGVALEGVNFYKNRILRPLFGLQNKSQILCYDLTAWAGLENQERGLTEANKNVLGMNAFRIQRLQAAPSADFFKWLQEENNKAVIDYVCEYVLKAPALFEASKTYPQTGVTLGEVFQKNCPILQNLYQMDTGKAYSALQFLEGLYLVLRQVEECLESPSDEISIIFGLPYDEGKYYRNPPNGFLYGLAFLLEEKLGAKLKGKKINVMFYTFRFQADARLRPYNAGKAEIDTLKREHVLDQVTIQSLCKEFDQMLRIDADIQ